MIADIEKSERELDFAQRKIKSLEDQVRKLKVENDQLKMKHRNMQTDLSSLTQKRSEIDNLHKVLNGIISNPQTKKFG